jgi:hypothetical protein
MTLLSICQAIADEISIIRPSTIVGNSNPEVQRLLRYADKAGTRMMKSYPWQILRKEKTFTGVAGETQTSILPSDFDRFVPETFWDRTNQILFAGPISPVEWNSLKAASYQGNNKFILRGDSVRVIPNLDGGESIAYEYVKKNWCQSSGGTEQAAWAADSDTGIIDEEMLIYAGIFEYLDGEGQPSGNALAQMRNYMRVLTENDQPAAGVMAAADIFGNGRHFDGNPTAFGTNINNGW